MKEKTLMTTAFLANFGDILTTSYGLTRGGIFERLDLLVQLKWQQGTLKTQ